MTDMNIIYHALLQHYRKEFTTQDVLQYIKENYNLGLRYYRIVHKIYSRISTYKNKGVIIPIRQTKEKGRKFYTYRFVENDLCGISM